MDVTFGYVAERYLKFKSDHGKRSFHQDKWILEKQLLPAFGAGLPIRQLSAEKIAAYEERRITEVSTWTVRNDLTILRHLRTAVESLAGLTPDAATLDRMTHKQSHSVESGTEQKVQTP